VTATATATAAGRPVGNIRSPVVVILLWLITLGIYGLIWFFKNHNEMKHYSGQGLGGGLALVLAIFVGIVMPFITASEVGNLYEREGMEKPVSGKTGLWILLPLVGIIIWMVKTQSALNGFWESKGATG
jgi:hypothetical protein